MSLDKECVATKDGLGRPPRQAGIRQRLLTFGATEHNIGIEGTALNFSGASLRVSFQRMRGPLRRVKGRAGATLVPKG